MHANKPNNINDHFQIKTQVLRLNQVHFWIYLIFIQQIIKIFKNKTEFQNLKFIMIELREKIIIFTDRTRLQQFQYYLKSFQIYFL
ncbi:unnamed protein product [Paramecium sonneborni]|uniref:Uncharacterized protein n=1 Tax=Paramecium sonneborni TaxID=65129 RepID=A0A8S1NRW2_9CILI|nr:unnamed protein product [Paramecium sonneborni]